MTKILAAATLVCAMTAGTAHAALISVDDAVYGAGSITRDTTNGTDWLDLTLSTGLSVNDILGGAGGFLANGFNLATLAQVEAMYTSGGWDGVDDSATAGSAAHAPFITSLFGLFGTTGANLNEGWALTDVAGIASRPFNTLDDGLGRIACTTFGFDTFAAPVNAFSSCRMDYDQSYGFIGAYLVREVEQDPAPVPEPSTIALVAAGLAAAGYRRFRR